MVECCALFYGVQKYVDCWMHPLPPLGITRVEAAEGATEVTIVGVRRADVRRVEVEEVGGGRRVGST
jgi:hypothetical protein